MIIRFDDNLNVETLNFAEESIRVGNNLVNEIKIFMPRSFDVSLYKAYLNFELNNGKQYNNIPTTMEFKTNEKETSEVCYYYPLQKFLSQQKGTLKLSVRISPINNIDIVANSGIITNF